MPSSLFQVLVSYSENPVRKKKLELVIKDADSDSHLDVLSAKFLEVTVKDKSITSIGGCRETKPQDLVFYHLDPDVGEEVEFDYDKKLSNNAKFTVKLLKNCNESLLNDSLLCKFIKHCCLFMYESECIFLLSNRY